MKILIVDDELISRKAMEKIFIKFGECRIAESGASAEVEFQQALNENQVFQLVVLDISMEDKSGLDVLKSLRSMEAEKKLEQNKRAKIFMATGNREMQMVKSCVTAGCNDYILKPLKPEVVIKKLADIGIRPVGEG